MTCAIALPFSGLAPVIVMAGDLAALGDLVRPGDCRALGRGPAALGLFDLPTPKRIGDFGAESLGETA